MKYIKFEKVRKGNHPIIRVTLKTFWGKEVVKDIVQSSLSNYWEYMECGTLITNYTSINTFYNGEDDVWYVNGIRNQ